MRYLASIVPDKIKYFYSFSDRPASNVTPMSPPSLSLAIPSSSQGPVVLNRPSSVSSDQILSLSSSSPRNILNRLQQSSLSMSPGFIYSSFNHAMNVFSNKKMMDIAYRFIPGHSRYIHSHFEVTDQILNKLKQSCQSIGLSCIPFSASDVTNPNRFGNGMRSLVGESYDKVLVEVMTFYNGHYGRLLILVSMGVSCTVWYLFAPGVVDMAPSLELFPRMECYDQFFNVHTSQEPFKKLCIIEQKYITEEVIKSLENDLPFKEMSLPESGKVRVAVGLGLMVGVFLAMGILPLSDSVLV